MHIGDILKNTNEDPCPSRGENNILVPYSDNNNQYSNIGSPYSHYSYQSPMHLLLSR